MQEQRRALELRLHTSNTTSNPAFKSSLNTAMLGIFDGIAKCILEPPTSTSESNTLSSFRVGSSFNVPGSITIKGKDITLPGLSVVLSKESKKEQNTLTTTASKTELEQRKEEEEENKEEEENLECIKFDSGVKGDFVSLYSRKLLARAARASNNPLIYITSTARDAVSQAHVMFNNLERDLDEQRRAYKAPGQAVIDVYVNMKANKFSSEEIKESMLKKINDLGPHNVSNHCADFNILNVVDISIERLSNSKLFKSTIGNYPQVRLLDENKVFHVEIKQS